MPEAVQTPPPVEAPAAPPPVEQPAVAPGPELSATNPTADALQTQKDQAQASGEPQSIEDTLRDFANVDKGAANPDEEAAIARAKQVLNPDALSQHFQDTAATFEEGTLGRNSNNEAAALVSKLSAELAPGEKLADAVDKLADQTDQEIADAKDPATKEQKIKEREVLRRIQLTNEENQSLEDKPYNNSEQVTSTSNEQQNNTDDASIEAQQKRLDDMMSKTPEELQKLAAEGNILAKRALSDMEKQVSAGAEALNKQVAETGDQSTVDGQAQFTEPSADQRAQGEQVQPVAEQTAANTSAEQAPAPTPSAEAPVPPTSETQAPAAAEAAQGPNPENKADAELTPEQKAVQERKQLIEGVQSLSKLGVDINSESGQKVLDLLAENPQFAEAYKAAAEAAEANMELGGPKGAAAAAEATANSLDEQIAAADKNGDTERSSKLQFLKKLLKALAIALLATTAVAVGGAAAVGIGTAGVIGAAASRAGKA
jgi:hypothetical protein